MAVGARGVAEVHVAELDVSFDVVWFEAGFGVAVDFWILWRARDDDRRLHSGQCWVT